jgi:hypothetical protein
MSNSSVVPIEAALNAEQRLASLEQEATTNLRASDEAFNKGMIALWTIKTEQWNGRALWTYARDHDGVQYGDRAKPIFEDYLYQFCFENGISRSGTLDHIKTIRVWVEALHLDPNLLLEAGVKRSRSIRNLATIDGRSGDIRLAKPEILENVFPGSTMQPQEEILKSVADYALEKLIHPAQPLSREDVVKAFTVDLGMEKYTYLETETGIECVYEGDGESWRGVVIDFKHLKELKVPKNVIENLIHTRLKAVRTDGSN